MQIFWTVAAVVALILFQRLVYRKSPEALESGKELVGELRSLTEWMTNFGEEFGKQQGGRLDVIYQNPDVDWDRVATAYEEEVPVSIEDVEDEDEDYGERTYGSSFTEPVLARVTALWLPYEEEDTEAVKWTATYYRTYVRFWKEDEEEP